MNSLRSFSTTIFSYLIVVTGMLVEAPQAVADDQHITVTIGSTPSGPDLAPQFSGLSYETSMLSPKDGKYYFDAQNGPSG